MAMKRCPDCGEKYSDSYKYCPFCEEEEILKEGKSQGGRRVRSKGQGSILTPVLVVLILLMAGLLIFLIRGDKQPTTPKDPVTPGGVVTPQQPSESEDPGTADEPGTEDPGTEDPGTEDPGTTDPTVPDTAQTDYDAAMALPDGLTLSTTDFTLRTAGETAAIRVSGGSGSYTWISQDDGVASVDSSGKVTAISKGTVNVVVTDGSKKGVCIVRCNVSGTASVTPTTPAAPSGTGSSTLQAGAAKVTGAGGGVFVRSAPNTTSEKLASLVDGSAVTVVKSAGDGWYEITFTGSGGSTVTGYMKGQYLTNG